MELKLNSFRVRIAAGFMAAALCSPLFARPLPTAGARALAMGGAYGAENEDVNTLFFNPAGLMGLTGPELSASYGRLSLGRASTITEGHGAYSWPTQVLNHSLNAAAGFQAQSVASGAHVFDIVGGAAMDVPTRGVIPWPVKGGAVLKIRHQQGNDLDSQIGKSSFGLGLDFGAQTIFSKNTAVGLALKDLYPSGANPPGPRLVLSGKQIFGNLAMALADVEVRRNVTALHLGTEWFLYRKLLRLRVGNGFSSDGSDHLALGAGFNFSPAQIDVAYLIPMRTFNDRSDQFRATLVYRFNAPKFSELYFDRALDMAEELDRRVAALQEKQAQLKGAIEDLEQSRRLSEEDLSRLSVRRVEGQKEVDESLLKAQNRVAEAEQRLRQLEERSRQVEERIRRAEQRGPARSAPVDTGPRQKIHVVQAGDTLRSIAAKYYKDPERWKAIFNANKDKINRGRPVVGTTLIIP